MTVLLVCHPMGWSINNPRVTVQVNGQNVFDGPAQKGFNAFVQLPPGEHAVEVVTHLLGGFQRSQSTIVNLHLVQVADPMRPAWQVTLTYSRLGGQFKVEASPAQ